MWQSTGYGIIDFPAYNFQAGCRVSGEGETDEGTELQVFLTQRCVSRGRQQLAWPSWIVRTSFIVVPTLSLASHTGGRQGLSLLRLAWTAHCAIR